MRILPFLFWLISGFLWANDRTTAVPKRTIKEVHSKSVPEKVARLERARIAIVDYELLKQDFPFLSAMTNEAIDHWLLDQVAYISLPQANQTQVNTPISVTDERRIAQRPPEYGRALVYEIQDPMSGKKIGLIDAKGTGSLKPGQIDHGNGLATLGEAIREYNYENLVRGVLVDSGVKSRTVGSYGVIDAGFDVIHADGSRSRAGIYLRQAHARPTYNGWLAAGKRNALEKLFWEYGIDANTNIQGTTSDDIYDFGHYIVRDDTPGLDPKKQIPFEQWGYDKSIQATGRDTRWFYSKHDRPWIWAHETAEAFARGKASRAAFERHYSDMVKPAISKLSACNSNVYAILNSLLTKH